MLPGILFPVLMYTAAYLLGIGENDDASVQDVHDDVAHSGRRKPSGKQRAVSQENDRPRRVRRKPVVPEEKTDDAVLHPTDNVDARGGPADDSGSQRDSAASSDRQTARITRNEKGQFQKGASTNGKATSTPRKKRTKQGAVQETEDTSAAQKA